jgi:DNA-binding transcriptional regulator YdaS (Cro superfamily)
MNEALHRAILQAGSQRALGKAIGRSQQQVSNWARGRPVSAENAIRIEKALGIPRHEIRPDLWERV